MSVNSKKKLKILFLTPRLPYPLIGGDKLKSYHILSYLSKNHDVTLVCLNEGEPPEEYLWKVNSLGLKLHVVSQNPGFTKAKASVLTLFGKPIEIRYFTARKAKNLINKLIEEEGFDLAISFFMRTAEYLKNQPIKKILMAEDCRVLYQKRSFDQSRKVSQKLFRFWEYKKLLKYEPEIAKDFDVVTLVTQTDIDAMKSRNDSANYQIVTNGVDLEEFKPREKVIRSGILFAGRLDLWANIIMVQDIYKNIFPLIQKQVPDAVLNIVGANPVPSILAMENETINIIPNVPDMKPYLQEAAAFLHPHSGGSGIQNKLLEGMACACPVVTTKTGIQGIFAKEDKDVLIGKNSQELASKTISLIQNRQLSSKISKSTRQMVEKNHSWESVFQSLDVIIEDLVKKK